jgi:hypothetical protein
MIILNIPTNVHMLFWYVTYEYERAYKAIRKQVKQAVTRYRSDDVVPASIISSQTTGPIYVTYTIWWKFINCTWKQTQSCLLQSLD